MQIILTQFLLAAMQSFTIHNTVNQLKKLIPISNMSSSSFPFSLYFIVFAVLLLVELLHPKNNRVAAMVIIFFISFIFKSDFYKRGINGVFIKKHKSFIVYKFQVIINIKISHEWLIFTFFYFYKTPLETL